jgi:hypothetical protein
MVDSRRVGVRAVLWAVYVQKEAATAALVACMCMCMSVGVCRCRLASAS